MEFVELFVNLGVPLFLLALGLFVGRAVEKRHFADLQKREQQVSDIYVTDTRTYKPDGLQSKPVAKLVLGEAVIATDYLKTFSAKLRNIFGGEVKSYQTLLIRARKEALLRMIEQAKAEGYNAICNVRFETADIGGNAGGNSRGVAMAAISASGTAYKTN